MNTFKVIVAGSRGFDDYQLLKSTLDHILRNKLPNVTIISGTASGADTLGEEYADKSDLECVRMPANWILHGKRAGYVRNTQMAVECDAVIVFWDGQSQGTKHMIEITKNLGKDIRIIRY